MDIIIKKTLTDNMIDDIITTAVEGGIGYWACLRNDDPGWITTEKELEKEKEDGKIKDVFYCTIIRRMLESGKAVKFQDADDLDNGEIWELTKQKFIDGCTQYETERGSIKKTLDDGSFDAVEADCLFQYALFKEVIYG